jgi:hypothetical protein
MEPLAPYGGAGVLWLPDNTPESRKHALETVYVGKQPAPKQRKKPRSK